MKSAKTEIIKGMLKACPHCGSEDSYSFFYYGFIHQITGIFGKGRAGEECIVVLNKNKLPVFAKCDACGRRIRLKDLRGE